MAKLFNVAFELSAKLSNQFKNTFGGADSQLASLRTRLSELSKSTATINKFRELQSQISSLSTQFSQAQQRVKQLANEINSTSNPSKKLINEFERAKASSSQLKERLTAKRLELGNVRNALQTAGIATANLVAREKQLITQTERARAAQSRLSNALQARQTAESKRAQYRGQIVDTAALVGVSSLPAMAIKNASEFQYQMQLTANTANLTNKEVAELTNKIYQLSAAGKTNQSITKLQEGFNFLLAAGMDKNVAVQSIETLGKVATASNAEVEDISKTLFALNTSLKIDPAQFNRSMDILVQAGKEGNFELRDMAQYLPQLTASAQNLGMRGAPAVASLGAALQIARKGAGDSAEAANNMKNFLSKLTTPETVRNFTKLGINYQAELKKGMASGDLVGYMIRLIQKATGGDQLKLGQLFGDMQVQNFVKPMIQNLKEYEEIKNRTFSAKGVVDQDYAKIIATNREQTRALMNTLNRIGNVIGSTLIPAFNGALQSIAPVVAKFEQFAKAHPELIKNIVLVTTGLIAFKVAAFALGYGMTFLTGGIATLRIAFALLAATPVVAVLAAATAGMVYFFTQTEIGRKAFNNLWNSIRSGIASIKQLFNDLIAWFLQKYQTITGVIDKVKGFFGGKTSVTSTTNVNNAQVRPLAVNPRQLMNSVANAMSVNYTPNIIINGNGDKNSINQAISSGHDDFLKKLQSTMRNEKRLSFG